MGYREHDDLDDSCSSSGSSWQRNEAFCLPLQQRARSCLQRPLCRTFLYLKVLVCIVLLCAIIWWHARRLDVEQVAKSRDVAPPNFRVEAVFKKVGCYSLAAGDAGETTETARYHSPSCILSSRSEAGECRSGLPFFSFAKLGGHVMSCDLCAAFCLGKGLDISGVVDATFCRCGSSARNLVFVDTYLKNRSDLVWRQSPGDETDCRIVVTRYAGRFPIPRRYQRIREADCAYFESFVVGRELFQVTDALAPEDNVTVVNLIPDNLSVANEASRASVPSNATQSTMGNEAESITDAVLPEAPLRAVLETQLPRCFPHQCSAGLPWPIKTKYLEGIPFAFQRHVPGRARQAFRAATAAYHAASCIRFTEVSITYNERWKIAVQSNKDGCYTNPIGYPLLQGRDTVMNLGWCNTNAQIGNIIHELGHVLGMSHEHTRPDRLRYVQIRRNIDPQWAAQYRVDDHAFVGDSIDGPAPYDYGSLMHYPSNDFMRTLPVRHGRGVHDSETGQRHGLSPLDVEQIRAMYSCDEPVENECIDMDHALGEAVKVRGEPATCKQVSRYCSHAAWGPRITYFCRQTCNTCPKEREIKKTSVVGCRDQSPFCWRYKSFCPGRERVGNEQWMALHCRRTCWIPRHCSSTRGSLQEKFEVSALDAVAPYESVADQANADLPCMDSPNPGFFNIAGEEVGCAALRRHCHGESDSDSVEEACPATCGLCSSSGPSEEYAQLNFRFVLRGDNYDLLQSDDKTELDARFEELADETWGVNGTLVLRPQEGCSVPCYRGEATLSVACCRTASVGCPSVCSVVRTTLSALTADEVNERLADESFSGAHVYDLSLEWSLSDWWSAFSRSETSLVIVSCLILSGVLCLVLAQQHLQAGAESLREELMPSNDDLCEESEPA
eukprot:TRINITY_DN4626_c0_g1_i2.p1 TRINITY_DN4626_c0_g1~~TRINITY_DN4626_c0_g1_i2.p1  ORF type:complete len:919 (+),score=56.89 TRINITY_DN4626_c0_g1_i2:64-2757(+)